MACLCHPRATCPQNSLLGGGGWVVPYYRAEAAGRMGRMPGSPGGVLGEHPCFRALEVACTVCLSWLRASLGFPRAILFGETGLVGNVHSGTGSSLP